LASYARTPEEIVHLWRARQKARGPVLAQMQAIKNQYNGDVVVPLPELDKDEKTFVANLIQQGLDQHAMRIASVTPMLTVPAADPRRPRAQERAATRRKATLGWWEANSMRRLMRRRARWLIGYSTAPVTLRPNFTQGIPAWHARNPLDAFPAPTVNPDDLSPPDSIYAVLKPLGWLRRSYPLAAVIIATDDTRDDHLFTVLEYEDHEQMCSIVVGSAHAQHYGMAPHVMLEQVPNRAGIPLSVHPGRITLDRLLGQFDGALGMYQMQAKLMALEVLAVQKGVFPDTYLVSRPGETAELVGGYHPGYSGLVNEVRGGDIKEITVNPSFATNQTIDRLERGIRLQGGIPPEFGGESQTNVRTGRRGDAILSATVDFAVQESQETLAASLEEENRRATKIARAYFGDAAKSFHVSWKGAKGHVTYTPNKDFDSDYSMVEYPSPGSDINNLVIGIGQRVGIGTMSTRTAMRLDPMVDDPELEADTVTAEALERAMLEGLAQQAAAGVIPPADLARIMQLVRVENEPLAEAVMRVQAEAQQRQATETAQGQPDAVPSGSPQAQPGLAQPGAGAEAGVAIQEPPTALGNLDQLLMQMRGTGAGVSA